MICLVSLLLQTEPPYILGVWSSPFSKHSKQVQLWCMQEMQGKECEGRFLGVKLDEYSAPGARQDRRDVDMEQGTASNSGRPERGGRRSGSHKGRQVTLLCTSPKIALQLHTCSSKVVGTNVKQGNRCSSTVFMDIVYHGHQRHESEALQRCINHKQTVCLLLQLSCDLKVLQLLQCQQCGFMLSPITNFASKFRAHIC